jgi:7-carboxy-7-deazaguanine synthase
MVYSVKEIFYTIQGEGANTGRPAVFCRFSGCNLWTGRAKDRNKAVCQFCDTDFVGTDGVNGGKFHSPGALAEAVAKRWPQHSSIRRFVVCTGGEPLLQMDSPLVEALHDKGFEIAIETNGTQLAPDGIDWICVSPKAGAELVLRKGHELKLVYPQHGILPMNFEKLNFEHFMLQPMDGPLGSQNTRLAVQYCLEHPNWRLSIQTHKVLGIP